MSTQPMTEAAAMRSTTKRVVEEVINGRNLDLLPQFFTQDYTWHLGSRDVNGLDQVREMMEGYLTAFSDLQIVRLTFSPPCHLTVQGKNGGPARVSFRDPACAPRAPKADDEDGRG